MNKETINTNLLERIKILMEYKSLNQFSLSKEIDFSYSTINKYFNKKSNTIDFDFIHKILTHYKDINANWLVCGVGEMFINTKNIVKNEHQYYSLDNETIIERLNKFIKYKGLTQRTFALNIGFNYSTLNNYLTGRRKTIDLELIEKVICHYKDLSTEWLMRGVGEMVILKELKSQDCINKLIDMIILQQNIICEKDTEIKELKNKFM